jgi:hypothetical protein
MTLGYPLNTYVLHLRVGGHHAAPAMGRIVHKFRDWLIRLKRLGRVTCPPVYAITFENPPPGSLMHANWMVHVPPGREAEFEKKLVMWATRVLGPLGPGDLDIQPIDQRYTKRLAKYVVKGTNPQYARHFFLEKMISDQGEVIGKRAGVSQAIGLRARKRASFHPGHRSYVPAPGRPAARSGSATTSPPSP